ncbi:MAG: class I SAM-dependent methyltransferase [Acidimicrobiales bacterium]
MSSREADEIAAFYRDHPYPPPVADLDQYRAQWQDPERHRVEHHRLWPTLPYRDDHTILVAGCGTSQAAKMAVRYPRAHIVGIDVSATSVATTRALVAQHQLTNVEVHEHPIETVADLGRSFDHIVCTGVIHHLAEPGVGLRALRDVLAPQGAMQLMVYATYGRLGISMMQDYSRRLGVEPTTTDIDDLVATLREQPEGHPIGHLLRTTPDFGHDDALADALLNPRERSFTVPELLDTVATAGLRFGRWVRQAPYRPQCGSLSEVPHSSRIASLPEAEQFAAVELFRGTMVRHSAVLHRDDSPLPDPGVRWDDSTWTTYVPLVPSTATLIEERLPDGAAAAVLNRAHVDRDLVLFLDTDERDRFEAIDGTRPLGEIAGNDPTLFEKLWWHDLVMVDASATSGGDRP